MICPDRDRTEPMVQRPKAAFSKKCAGRQIARKMRQEPGHSRSCNVRCVLLLMGCPRSALLPFYIRCTKQGIPGRSTAPGATPAEPSKKGRMGRSTKVKIPIRKKKNGD